MALRTRIVLTLIPLFVLLAGLGVTGVLLLSDVGTSIDRILQENYRSVIAMKDLNEALERIDSSFQFTLAGHGDRGRPQYEANWKRFETSLRIEQGNVTLPGEQALVDRLSSLSQTYRQRGDAFYAANATEQQRSYFGGAGRPGILDVFQEIKEVSSQIVHLNEENMKRADREARHLATRSLAWFSAGLGVVVVLGALLVVRMVRMILQPIQSLTRSVSAVGAGNLDQVVPVLSRDELGRLADEFNRMARQLREYRQAHSARLLRAQRTSQAAIDSFPHPLIIVDGEGRLEMANPVARRLLGLVASPEPAAGPGESITRAPWQPPEILRQPIAEALLQQRAYLPEGFDRVFCWQLGNQECYFLPRVLPIRDADGATLGAAVLLEDVTRFRLLDQVKSNLVATASHELKTPLTGLRLALHVLLEETVGPLTPKQLELLLDARDNAERLLAMVNEMLDLARLEQGARQLDTAPHRPVDLLRTAAEAVQARADDKGVAIHVEAPDDLPEVAVDPQRLGHALENLLNNAVVYTNPGGHVVLRGVAESGAVVFEVEDTGIGIPPEYLPHVFEKFFRVPGQGSGGTGLGLAIVHEVVAAHGGTIACESQVGQGTIFRLRLPVWKPIPTPV